MKFSVSRLATATGCARKFQYKYVDKIERNYIDTGVMSWGKVFHSAMATALRTWYYLQQNGPVDPLDISEAIQRVCEGYQIEVAEKVAETNLSSDVCTDIMLRVEDTAEEVAQIAYRTFLDMRMGENFTLAPYSAISNEDERFTAEFQNLDEYQEFVNAGGTVLEDYPLVEYRFDYDLPDGNSIQGYIDAVLIDLHSGQYVLTDFKTVKGISDLDKAQQEEYRKQQLPVYQWILRQAGLPVTQTLIYQVLRKLPREPKIVGNGPKSKKKRLERNNNMVTDRATYMGAILRYGFDPADYEDILERLDERKWFQRVYSHRSNAVLNRIMADVEQSIKHLKMLNRTKNYPAYNDWRCFANGGCPFVELCDHVIRGGEVDDMIGEDSMYRRRE